MALPVDCEGGDAVIPNVKQKGEAAIGQSQSSEHNFRLASANQSQSSQSQSSNQG